MTIMAGVFSRSHTQQPPTALCDQIRSLLSRHPTDKVHEFIDDCIWMAKIDIEAFGVAGYHRDPDGSISMLTGDPLLDDGGLINRYASLETLHRRLIANDYRRTTARTRGSFCMACYAPNKQLILITDRLGLRSMYVAVYDNIVIFATAFRIFKALRGIQKSPDLMSLTEICTYGVPLGDRSEFLEIKRLLPSEIVVINQEYIRRSFYWRWDSIKPISREDFVETLYREFKKSVILRLMEDRTVLSFLSGGLDSRSIVAVLVGEGARVHTMGLGNRNSQDGALAPKFAEAIGSHHIQCDTDGPSEGEWWERVAKAVTAVQRSASPFSPERPRLVWNGEGGSVCLGHVHLSQRIVDLCRGDDRTAFLREFASYNSWLFGWQRVMRRSWWEELSSRVNLSYREEMTRVTPIDSGRLPYFFLLFNDQRRKLESLEANADLIRAEMLTPFFDMELLSLISAARIDEFIGHDLYVKWLQQFQFPVYSVAWQSYPGHVPCSVPVPADLEYQWHRKAYLDRRLAVHMVSRCLTPSSFPGWILRRDVVMAAGILTLLGVRNYGYLLDPARRFCEALAPKGQPQPNKHLIRPSTQGSARRP